MKKILKIAIIVLILVVISVILFITGKRHDIFIENNSSTGIKYSINGEPYKTLDTGRKAEGVTKGISNVIFIKTNDNKVIEKDLPSNDINIFIENNSSTGIKYSINGEPYKTLDTGKKAMGTVKGIDNVIFIKTNDDKVIEKDIPSDDVNIFINEIINNSENWYKENTENQ